MLLFIGGPDQWSDPGEKATESAMLDIAYLALMVACLAACAGLVDLLARGETPQGPVALPNPTTEAAE